MKLHDLGMRRLLAVTIAAAAVLAVQPGAAPANAVAAVAPRVTTYPAGKGPYANPGVVYDGHKWVVLSTGSWSTGGHIATATEAKGPYTTLSRHLLSSRPAWASSTNHSVWAPSIVRGSDGRYTIFYAAVKAGTSGRRCIGTATSAVGASTGPFVPHARPIACWQGSGTQPYDPIPNEGGNVGLIDATPARVGGQVVLTYKTEHGYKSSTGAQMWHTTTRMLRLDPAAPWRTLGNPVHSDGHSIQITSAWDKYIEENPVLVQHGTRYTLFNSFGWYGTCTYYTRYRQNAHLWTGWLAKSPTRLSMPSGTCGTGNAQVVRGLPTNSWRVFYNGHTTSVRRSPFTMYVGIVAWSSTGRPSVTRRL